MKRENIFQFCLHGMAQWPRGKAPDYCHCNLKKSTKYLVKVKQEIKHTSLDIYDLDA